MGFSPQEGRSGLLPPSSRRRPRFWLRPSPASPHRGLAAFASLPLLLLQTPAPHGWKYQQSTPSPRFSIYIPTPGDPFAQFATAPPGPVSPVPARPAAAPSGKIPLRRLLTARSRPAMPVQVGGSKVAEPRARVELSPAAVADKGRASSKKFRRRQKKAATSLSPMQRLFDTSREVFAGSSPGFVPPPDAVARLSGLLNDLKPQDVGVDSSMPYFKHAESKGPPRVSYLHFYDCPKFSFGIFCLPKSAVIPLHNHPGMTVFSKILFGSMHLKSYDWAKSLPDSNDNALENSDGARLAKVNTDAVFDASAETIVLYPENGGNLHCFTALTPCAVLDVLGPPYDRDDGRDCSYYDESPYLSSSGGNEQYSWLKEVTTNFEMKGTQMPCRFSIQA